MQAAPNVHACSKSGRRHCQTATPPTSIAPTLTTTGDALSLALVILPRRDYCPSNNYAVSILTSATSRDKRAGDPLCRSSSHHTATTTATTTQLPTYLHTYTPSPHPIFAYFLSPPFPSHLILRKPTSQPPARWSKPSPSISPLTSFSLCNHNNNQKSIVAFVLPRLKECRARLLAVRQ